VRLRLGLAILGVLALAAAAAPLVQALLGHDPNLPDLFARYEAPSWSHPLGTDALGRDALLRLLGGARVSLAVGVVTALVAAAIGTAVGLLAAWAGGFADAALMRLAETMLALPALPLLLVLAAADLPWLPGGDIGRIVLVLAIFGWMGVARLARAAAITTLALPYVRAARALGAGEGRMLWRHVLPALAPTVAVATALAVAGAILAESTLSFLGLGIRPPLASWGNMLANAQEMVLEAPWQAVWPGLCIMAAVAGAGLVADGARR